VCRADGEVVAVLGEPRIDDVLQFVPRRHHARGARPAEPNVDGEHHDRRGLVVCRDQVGIIDIQLRVITVQKNANGLPPPAKPCEQICPFIALG